MPVIGTAGHVDHGKTLLIEALTGIDTDRLPEEKRRGLTIDLGFAHFSDQQGRAVGVIDVPGHERFIRNMVAGAWGLDLALLVVAADDGWMQQSADHARVLRLMGLERLLLVVSKADLVPPRRLEQVRAEALERCRELGWAAVPSLAVSALSGQNIPELKALILAELPSGQEQAAGAPLLYIDRVFSVAGCGVVVTGSLRGGSLRTGQELLLLPRGRTVRVRAIQSYFRELEAASPGSRVALNLAGIGKEQLQRGDLLTVAAARVALSDELVARLAPAPQGAPAPKPRDELELEVALGTGHQPARMLRLAEPGLVRLRLTSPAPLYWNQPLVLIRQGGSAIVGGGRVLWPAATTRHQCRLLAGLAGRLPAALSAQHLLELRLALEGAVPGEEARQAGPAAVLPAGSEELGGWLLSGARLRELEQGIIGLAGAPGGVRLDELGSRIPGEGWAGPGPAWTAGGPERPNLPRLVARRLVERGALVSRGGVLLPAGKAAPGVSPMGKQLLADLERSGTAGLELNRLRIAGARKELRNLVRAGLAVGLDGNIFYSRKVYLDLLERLRRGLSAGSRFGIAEAKARTGLSRKYIIPLLNRLEAEGYLERSGDERIVTARTD